MSTEAVAPFTNHAVVLSQTQKIELTGQRQPMRLFGRVSRLVFPESISQFSLFYREKGSDHFVCFGHSQNGELRFEQSFSGLTDDGLRFILESQQATAHPGFGCDKSVHADWEIQLTDLSQLTTVGQPIALLLEHHNVWRLSRDQTQGVLVFCQ